MLYVYIGCLTFGIAYAVASILLSGHGFDDGGMDGVDGAGIDAIDIDTGIDAGISAGDVEIGDLHGDADHLGSPSPFSPVVIASAIATFGAIGIIGKLGFKMDDLLSAVIALSFAGAIGAGIFFGIVKFMYGSQSNSTFSINDIEGMEAEVITPIPEKGMGEIAYVISGVRHSMPARSAHSKKIERGDIVRIKEIHGNVALVFQRLTIDDIELLEFEEGSKNKNKNNNL